MRLWASSRLLTFIAGILQTRICDAIFSDEAYNLDFHHALIGFPQSHTTFFHRPNLASKGALLYSLSESGVLGAVNPKDGALVWRQFLGEGGYSYKGVGQLRTIAGCSILASLLHDRLQAWDAADGRLMWQWEPNATVHGVEVIVNAAGTWIIAVWQDEAQINHVSNFFAEDGKLLWQYDDSSGDLPYRAFQGGGHLYYVSLHSVLLKGYRVKALELDITSGAHNGRPGLLHSENEVSTENSILFAGAAGGLPLILWADKSLKTIRVGTLLTNQATTLDISSAKDIAVDAINVHTCSDPGHDSRFLLHFQGTATHSAIVFGIDSTTGRASKLYDLPPVEGQGSFAAACQSSDSIFIHATTSEMVLLSSASADALQTWPLEGDTVETGCISHIAAEVVAKGPSKYSLRSALTRANGDWQMVRNEELIWTKKEGLHGVVAAAFAEVPFNEKLSSKLGVEGQGNVFFAYMHRLQRHWRDLQSLRLWLSSTRQQFAGTSSTWSGHSNKADYQHDKFGYNKLVIVATKTGRLAALDTGKAGKVVWDVKLWSDIQGNRWQVSGIDVELSTVLIRCEEGPNVRVDLATGKIVERSNTHHSNDIKIKDHLGQLTNVSVRDDGRPNQDLDSFMSDHTVLVTKDKDLNLIGWKLSPQRLFTVAWTFQPLGKHNITEVNHRPDHDPVASIGRVLGDRNVLYKFISPNLLLVTCEDQASSHVSINLIDAISGSILHSVEHSDVDLSMPVSTVISENLFVYGMYSLGETHHSRQSDANLVNGYQLTVNEIFESPFPNDRGVQSLNHRTSSRWPATQPGQANSPSIYVASRSFLAPEPLSRFSFITTLQSISPRSLLCLTEGSNSIVAIPRYILDPRRPIGRAPTSIEIEEGLFRYDANLDFDPKWFVNHKRESLGFLNVITSPSLLESTSLVFAYGEFDLFGTRISPIGGFDVLGKAFSKFQLVATVVALAVGTAGLAPLVRKKQVDGTWRN